MRWVGDGGLVIPDLARGFAFYLPEGALKSHTEGQQLQWLMIQSIVEADGKCQSLVHRCKRHP